MEFQRSELPARLFFMLMGAFMFSVIGAIVPGFYYRYLDRTDYYTVEQPVSVDKEVYAPCEETILIAKRNSLIDTSADFSTDLTLVSEDGSEFKVPNGHINTEASVRRGEVVMKVAYKLPCDIVDGRYFWQSTMNYKIRGIDKTYIYITEVFEVSESGKPLPANFKQTTIIKQASPIPVVSTSPNTSQPTTQNTTVINESPRQNDGTSATVNVSLPKKLKNFIDQLGL